jgi:hypothetical protein
MARDFVVGVDRGQLLLTPPSLVEWLAEDHLVWTVLGAVEVMDLRRFSDAYRLGAAGRPPYDPEMMGWWRFWCIRLPEGTGRRGGSSVRVRRTSRAS